MPTNKSHNKVRVTRLFGTEAQVGLTDPKVNMKVTRGITPMWVKTLDSGNFQVGLALSSGGPVVAKAYPHELTCSTGVAGYFGWPNGTGSITLGRKAGWPNGVPTISGNGMVYQKGNGGEATFTR